MTKRPNDDVRGFGLVMLAAALLLAWRLRHDGLAVIGGCVTVGAAVALLSFVAPAVVRPLAKAWGKLGHLLGRVTTPVLLVVVFVLVVTPLRLLLMLLSIDPLALQMDRSVKSHFVERSKKVFDKDDFERLS